MVSESRDHMRAEMRVYRELRVPSKLKADPEFLAPVVTQLGQIAVELRHSLTLQIVPRCPVEAFGRADINAVLCLKRVLDGLTVAVEVLLMGVGHMTAMLLVEQ